MIVEGAPPAWYSRPSAAQSAVARSSPSVDSTRLSIRRMSSACGGSVMRRRSSQYSERGDELRSTWSLTYSGVIVWTPDNVIALAEPYARIADEYVSEDHGPLGLSLAEFIILDPFERGLLLAGGR